jgi:NAD(P)H dehydrogenase (quinone)
MSTLAVTGSTGNIGGRLARSLSASGIEQRLVVRDPARAPVLPGATVVQATYADGEAGRRALDGIETLFMVSGAEAVDRLDQHRTFVDAAVAAGVHRIVYTSFYGAAPDSTFTLGRDHWVTEQYIRATGLGYTFLRDSLYLDFFRFMVGEDGVIRGPAGDGRVAAVAQDDIAEVAAVVVRDPSVHNGRTYDLTGREALTFHDIAAVLGVRYHAETLDEAYASRAGYGAPDWQVDAWVSTYTAIAAGELAGISADVEELTGHPPRTLADVVHGGS